VTRINFDKYGAAEKNWTSNPTITNYDL